MNVAARLTGRTGRLTVSDPWELTDASRSNVLAVAVENVDSYAAGASVERLLLRLDRTLAWKSKTYEFLVAERRPVTHGLVETLTAGETAACNALGVSKSDALGGAPWGATHWRGGLAIIGDLVLKSEN